MFAIRLNKAFEERSMALTRSINHSKASRGFIARGLASSAQTRKTGKYVSAGNVMAKLVRKLAKVRRRTVFR